ncbi:MAG: 4-hydroxybenzoyl-CoA thioesterase [Enterobacterales bacterium]|jgi:4-hydroxybenzoyl-CoA thioesterase
MKTFNVTRKIRFGHIDAAGIAFYPRLVEMLNDTVEDFFDQAIDYSFQEMHLQQKCGLPTVSLKVDFKASIALGDEILWSLNVLKISRSSFSVRIIASSADVEHLSAEIKLVYVQLTENGIKSTLISDEIRKKLAMYSLDTD